MIRKQVSRGWVVLLAGFLLGASLGAPCQQRAGAVTIRPAQAFYVKNVGQYPPGILYYTDISGGRLWVREHDLVLSLVDPAAADGRRPTNPDRFPHGTEGGTAAPTPRRISNIFLTFPSGESTRIDPVDETVTRLNIFKGNDACAWHADIPTYGHIRISEVLPGVDLVLDASGGGPGPVWHLDGSQVPAAGALLPRIDARGASRAQGGEMEFETEFGLYHLPAPAAPSPPLSAPGGDRDGRAAPLTQQLLWGTFLGGQSVDIGYALAVDGDGNILVGGTTGSQDFPVPNGYDTFTNSLAGFIAKLSPSGSQLLWGTFLGGSTESQCTAMAVDAAGNVVAAGFTDSTDFPVPNGFATSNGGGFDAFVAKLSASGSQLLWGTYYGGSYDDKCGAIGLDASGNVAIAGSTTSSNLPVPGGFDTSYNGGFTGDSFVAKISASGSQLQWGTYLGGSQGEGSWMLGLDLDSAGGVVVCGTTESSDFPVLASYDTAFNGGEDAFVVKLSADGSQMLWGTFLGGYDYEGGLAVALDSSDNVVVGGYTESPDFPVPYGYDTSLGGYRNAFVAKLSADGSQLLWGTYLGGSSDEVCYGLALDGSANVFAVGRTLSCDFPVPNGYDTSCNGGGYNVPFDGFAAELSASGSQLLWGTYLGGSADDECYAVAVGGSGNAVVAGQTASANFPVPNGYDTSFNDLTSSSDVFVVKLSGPTGPTCSVTCTASASPTSGTAPLTVHFSSTATPSNCAGAPAYTWVFGDGGTSAQQNPSHTYASAGNYSWTLTVTVDGQTCSKGGTLAVSPACSVACSATVPATGTAGAPVAFQSSATPSGCTGSPAYAWAFGDGGTAAQQNPSHTYSAGGTYAWALTVTVGGKTCSKNGSISISEPPPCTLSCSATAAPGSGTPPLTVTFSASATASNCSGAVSFRWDFGDGESSTQKNTGHAYEQPGSYTWLLTATVESATCSKTGTITVSEPPCSLSCSASATPQSGSAPLSVVFAATAAATGCSGNPAFAWDFGDGGTSDTQNPAHSYAVAGNYAWTLAVTQDGQACSKSGTVIVTEACSVVCSASATPSLGIAPLAVAFAGGATPSHCTGDPAYLWTFGDGTTSAEQNPSHTYAATGEYLWNLTVSADGTPCSRSGTVVVAPPCTVTCTATVPAAGTPGTPLTFQSTATPSGCSGAPSFAWSFGDGGTSSEQSPSHVYAAAGTFAWTLAVSAEGITCSRAGSIAISEECSLTCEASATPTAGSAPLQVVFSATATASHCTGSPVYAWAFGDGGTSFEQSPPHTYATPGDYGWTLTVTADGRSCSRSGTVTTVQGVPGDGNGDGVVSIGEVQQAINMFLGVMPPGNGSDCNGDGTVSIGEVQKVINAFLGLPSSC